MPLPPRGLTVPFTEPGNKEGDSPNESFDADGSGASRLIDVAWNSRGQAMAELLGYSWVDKSDPNLWRLRRRLPDFHPDFPGMIAISVGPTKGLGSRGQQISNGKRVNTYEKARLPVQYKFPDYDVLEDSQITTEFDRFRTLEFEPCAEYLSPPQTGLLKWSQGPNVTKEFPGNVGYVMGTLTFRWDWLQVPYEGLPFNTIRRRIGCVNSDTFANCEPGTLLLMPPKIRRVNGPTQFRTWTISYFAIYVGQVAAADITNPSAVHTARPGHNWFYDFSPNSKTWCQASVDGTFYAPGSMPDGKCLYNERPFRDLFNVNSG